MEIKGLGKESSKLFWNKIKTWVNALFGKSVTDVGISGKTVTITKGDGTKSTQTTQDTTYNVVSKSENGLAPQLPNETSTTKYLRQDGTWAVPPNQTYSKATQSSDGLMAKEDKTKLDGIEDGAQKNQSAYSNIDVDNGESGTVGSLTEDDTLSLKSGENVKIEVVSDKSSSADGNSIKISATDTTYDSFTIADAGLVPAPGENGAGGTMFMNSKGEWKKPGFAQEQGSTQVNYALMFGNTRIDAFSVPPADSGKAGALTGAMYSKLDDLPTVEELNAAADIMTESISTIQSRLANVEGNYAKKSEITGVYRPKGSVADASKLPTSGQQAGDVWSIEADSAFGPAGMNVVWTSDGKWDNLGGIVTMVELTQEDIDEICV